MSPTFPPEIVSDILSRLPVKALLRFQCTSKTFCSMIDDPDFTKLHLNQTNSNQSLILSPCHPLLSIDLRSLERAVKMKIKLPLKTLKRNTVITGSCNGLLCLYKSEAEIVIWNMSTRKHHLVPPAERERERNSHRIAHGFGYDSVHDDYKVVRMVQFGQESEVMVYSLKSNSWKRAGGLPYALFHPFFPCLFAQGALHLLMYDPTKPDNLNFLIVAFDLSTEEFREIPRPTETVAYVATEHLGVFEGHIYMLRTQIDKQTDMWVLKNHGANESWAKLISTSLTSSKYIMPLSYLSNGNELLILLDFNKFLRYDLETNKVENFRIQGLPPSFLAFPYVESLVKPLPMVNEDGATTGRSKKNVAKRGGFLSKVFKLFL